MNSLLVLAQQGDNIGGEVAVSGVFLIMVLLISLVSLVLWLWALIDAIRNPALDSTMKLVWILVIIFLSPIGAILYLLIGRSSATRADL